MRDIFFTILIIWVLYKILGRGSVFHVYTGHSDRFNRKQEDRTINKAGEIKINYKSKKKNNNDEGEYVDYEEVK